jgi:hypothetical protein
MKCTIRYACGHGSFEKQFYGKDSSRLNSIAWSERNIVCPECYKAQKRAADAKAPKQAKLVVIAAVEPMLAIELSGQLEANDSALKSLGYSWMRLESYIDLLSMDKAKLRFGKGIKPSSEAQIEAWIAQEQAAIEALGYALGAAINPFDLEMFRKSFQKVVETQSFMEDAAAKLAYVQAIDPKPPISPLAERIAKIKKEKGGTWNGTIYGVRGRFCFYVNNVKYSATDEEVFERTRIQELRSAWNEKYKDIIEAANRREAERVAKENNEIRRH